MVTSAHQFDCDLLRKELEAKIENFNARGSGFVLDLVYEFTLVITKFRSLAGSSYIQTPPAIAKKRAVVKVKNNDQCCFEYASLSCLYPAPSDHAQRVSNYTKYQGNLNFNGILFPVQLKDIPKFESFNPHISVNVTSPDPDNIGYTIDYLSPERHRPYHVKLLLLYNTELQHYVWIKNFPRLVSDRTKHNGASFGCNSCLNVFSSQRVFDFHIPLCLQHPAQQTIYPQGDEAKLKLRTTTRSFAHFYSVCDFESVLVPSEQQSDTYSKTRIIDEHKVSGFLLLQSHRSARVSNLTKSLQRSRRHVQVLRTRHVEKSRNQPNSIATAPSISHDHRTN